MHNSSDPERDVYGAFLFCAFLQDLAWETTAARLRGAEAVPESRADSPHLALFLGLGVSAILDQCRGAGEGGASPHLPGTGQGRVGGGQRSVTACCF